ncbi:MAG: S41 family peptidase [Candidatus Omnitrophica bacterium]|nr:S41 family peptidase [Candidatus Omnitrophota bacterium]MCM8790392.1 S41 family peptidase [Candidatus Omnitrophota bacterium]
MKKCIKGALAITTIILVASVAMGGFEKTAADKDREKAKSKDNLYQQVELLADAISIVRSDYVDEVDSKKLIYGALKGMLSSLDDYSQFMEPDEYDEIKVETRGEFGGVGVEISLRDGILTVVSPIAGTPAEAAGIKAGDKIVKIDGKITKKMTLSEAVKLMRGKPGTMVTLTIWREGERNIFDVPIKRALVKVTSIKKADFIEDKIGYIKMVEFQENTTRDLDASLRKLESQGMDSLILDLRNNPGGLLEGAVDVAERFLPKDKVIVSIKARVPSENAIFKSSGRFNRGDYPLIVIVNEGSASASEIVAGAIKDNKRGIVIGTKTFGKASVQTVIPLKDGSALRFTTASYLTPSGKLIKNEGIMPDVVVERDRSETKKKDVVDIFEEVEQIDSKRPQEQKAILEEQKDNQLDAAVNLMKAIKVYKSEKT